jgi:DNA-binding MarR family transcriptional regulator
MSSTSVRADRSVSPRRRAGASAERARQIDHIAERLPARAAILVRLLVRQMRRREISRTEMEVLSVLSEHPRRITELTELAGTAQPTMTLLAKRLEEKGWVTREDAPEDGRVVLIRITAAGVAAYRTFRAEALAAMRADLEPLSDRELQALAAATDTLSSFVEELQIRAER